MKSLVKEVSQLSSGGHRRRPPIRYLPNLLLLPRHLVDTFCPLEQDEETRAWLGKAGNFSVLRLVLVELLGGLCSRTTANGIAGRGSMFVFSTEQVRRLLVPRSGPADAASDAVAAGGAAGDSRWGPSDEPPFRRVLDIGAGDGGVTAKLAPMFAQVFVTECSWSMRWRLWWRGYTVVDHRDPFHIPIASVDPARRTAADPEDGYLAYDVISCLNVLDRADRPLTLLRTIHASLKPEGLLLLAVVLPWCPFVENGARQAAPTERLPMAGGECCTGAGFEASLQRLVENVLTPCGFKVERWTKAPYLCEGNFQLEYALLHDAVLVLSKVAS